MTEIETRPTTARVREFLISGFAGMSGLPAMPRPDRTAKSCLCLRRPEDIGTEVLERRSEKSVADLRSRYDSD
jgi:hypothetical protein